MALATCEIYLLDEFVKPPFETWPPKLCQTHIWQDIAQNIRSNISFNKSDNIFLSKTILILFVRCFGEKNRNTSGTYLPEIFLTNLLGWLVISQKCPKHFFGHYPSAILLEISPTNSPCRNFAYTRICSNRSVFFLYTKQNLHQKMFTPKNFFTRRGFTPNSFYIKTPTANELHQTVFTPGNVYTRRRLHLNCLHPKVFNTKTFLTSQPVQQNMSTSEAICAKYIVFDLKRLLHPRHFTPKSFYTKAFLH